MLIKNAKRGKRPSPKLKTRARNNNTRTAGKPNKPKEGNFSPKIPSQKGKRKPQKSKIAYNRYGTRLTVSELQSQKKIVFVGKDPNGRMESKIRLALKDSFTQEEIRAMGRVVVEFNKLPKGKLAAFYRRYDESEDARVRFDPEEDTDWDDIVHEFVHALKAADASRTDYAATNYKRTGGVFDHLFRIEHEEDLLNAEEATVVAESAIRTKEPAKRASGYYDEIPNVGRDTAKMKKAYDEDRLTLLDSPKGRKVEDTKGVRGKTAVNKLNKNFPKTNISKKSVNGQTALQSYERLKSIKK